MEESKYLPQIRGSARPTRRFSSAKVLKYAGAYAAAFIVVIYVGVFYEPGAEVPDKIRYLGYLAVGIGFALGALVGAFWKLPGFKSANETKAEDFIALTDADIKEHRSGFRVGKRVFANLHDAKAFLYHTNIQRELIRQNLIDGGNVPFNHKADSTEPLNHGAIEKRGSWYCVGKREFPTLHDAKEFLYLANVQKELSR